jgi:Peptidase family S41
MGVIWSAGGLPQLNVFDLVDPFIFGSLRSYVPTLGDVVWELGGETSKPGILDEHIARCGDVSDFIFGPFACCYICRLSDGRLAGFLRISHYSYDDRHVSFLRDLIAFLEDRTVVLILDQNGNAGGNMFNMYALLSCLSDKPLALPKHEFMLSDDDIDIASDAVDLANAGSAIPVEERPSPEYTAFARFVVSEAKAGFRRPTSRYYLGGITEISPGRRPYTGKIIVLIDALTFSAAEFLAAILQDNKRATLFGARTVGGGGCARERPTGQLGHNLMTRWTEAVRTNGQPIEGIGVFPDVRCQWGADLRWRHRAFETHDDGIRYRNELLTAIGRW